MIQHFKARAISLELALRFASFLNSPISIKHGTKCSLGNGSCYSNERPCHFPRGDNSKNTLKHFKIFSRTTGPTDTKYSLVGQPFRLTRWPIVIGWHPSSWVLSISTRPILTKFGMCCICMVKRQEVVNFMTPHPKGCNFREKTLKLMYFFKNLLQGVV